MSILFKSKREREKESRKEKRQAFRKADNALDDVKERIKDLERGAKKQWEDARAALQGGQKASASRQLTSYRAAQVLMTKLEQKRWVFEQYVAKMHAASSDAEFATALDCLNKVTVIDPEKVSDVFAESQDLLGEQLDADRFWNKLYEKEMDGAGAALEDYIPSLEELSGQLEAEAAAEIGASAPAKAAGQLVQCIESGRAKVKDLLDSK